MARWVNCSKGVRYREHETQRHNKRADRYYMLTYKRDGKTTSEGIGWASDGHTQAEAEDLIETLRKNWRSGAGPQSLREMRAAELAKARAAQEVQDAIERRATTLASYWTTEYFPFACGKTKESTWKKEEQHFRIWINPALGDMPLESITMAHWDALAKQIKAAGRSQRSCEYIIGTLRRALRHAQKRGWPVVIPKSEDIGASAPADNQRKRVLKPAEKKKLLDALAKRDVRVFRPVYFAMLTGCRLMEAMGLKWGAVDLEAETVQFLMTKNKHPRTIPLAKPLKAMLVQMREEMAIAQDESPPAGRVVFPSERGKPWTAVPGLFLVVVEELKFNEGRDRLDRVSFHTMRHTMATDLAKTLDIRSLMAFMGWRNIAMAARYIHPDEKSQRYALAKVAGLLTHTGEVQDGQQPERQS